MVICCNDTISAGATSPFRCESLLFCAFELTLAVSSPAQPINPVISMPAAMCLANIRHLNSDAHAR